MSRKIPALLFLGLALFAPLAPQIVFAATGAPKILNYQGRLMDSSGNLLGGTGTNYCFRFSIFDAATVGSGSKVWPTATPSTMTVSVKNGIFNAGIGDTGAGGDVLDYNFQDSDAVYLNVDVASMVGPTCAPGDGAESYESLSPRQRLVSSGYAVNANTVGGFAPAQSATGNQLPVLSSGNLQLGASAPVISATSTNTLTIQGSGATGNLQFFNASNRIDSLGNMTLGGVLNIAGGTATSTLQSSVFGTSSIQGFLNVLGTNSTSTFSGGVSVAQLTVGSLTGVLHATAGAVTTALVDLASDITGVLPVANGGTGTSTVPTYGKLLVGNVLGGYDLVATSSLGISGGVADGSFSTTSASYFSSLGLAFSTTSSNHFTSAGLAFSTTSDAYFLSQNQGNAFSTTSASVFSAAGLAFSTTSSNYWKGVNDFFSTSSASYFSSVGLAFSTTSALTFSAAGLAFSTTSSNFAVNSFINASTTIPKTFAANTFTGSNTFSASAAFNAGLTATNILATGSTTLQNFTGVNATTSQATTTYLAITGVTSSLLKTLSSGAVVAAVAGTDYLTSGTESSFSTTSASYFSSLGLAFSTTSNNFYASAGLSFSTTSNNYWKGVNDFFSTTSALNFANVGLAFSTTSSSFWSSAGLGFSTTSALAFSAAGLGFSTTSSNFAVNAFVNASTTIPKTYSSNAFTGSNAFNAGLTATNILATGSTTLQNFTASNSTTTNATTTSLAITGISGQLLKTLSSGAVVAAVAGTDYLTSGTESSFSTTSASYFSSLGLAFSTTSSNYFLSQNQGNAFSTTSAINFANSSSTIPKTYTANTYLGANSFQGGVTIGSLNGLLFGVSGSVGTVATNTLGLLASSSISATGPLQYAAATGVFSITQANAGTSGYLSLGDWSTFNNKLGSTSLQAGTGISYNPSTGLIANTIGYAFPGNATGTQLAFNGGIAAVGATTTSLTVSSVTSSLLKTLSNGAVVAAVAGTDYAAADTSFSTTSASYFSSLGLAFSTTSNDYYTSVGLSFSTTSASAFSAAGLAFSTTSSDYYITASTSIVKTSVTNTFTAKQNFGAASSTIISVALNGNSTTTLLGNATSTFGAGIQATAIKITGNATSSFANGIDLTDGCFSVNGTCIAGNGQPGNTGTLVNIQTFAASGTYTYTPSVGAASAQVIVTGGGGGGGTGSATTNVGGAGGAGGTSIAYIDLTSTTSVQVTVGGRGNSRPAALSLTGGTGGVSRFSTFATASGGIGGTGGSAGNGGLGGAAGTGDIALPGGDGSKGASIVTDEAQIGGASYWGGGARFAATSTVYGAGGGPNISSGSSGAGGGGIVVVYEYGPFNGVMNTANGGTGIAAAPAYGQVLVGQSDGTYALTATSSLGLVGDFSTTSALTFSAAGLAFSTTSSDYWQSVNDFFSTSSAGFFSSNGLAFSTTSSNFWSSAGLGFSTTSALTFSAAGLAFSTTSSNFAVNAFVSASSTIPKTYTSNTFTAANSFTSTLGVTGLSTLSGGILTNASSTFGNIFALNATTSQATTTNLAITGIGAGLLMTLSSGAVVAAVAGTDYLTSGTESSFSTTSASYFSFLGLAFSTTSSTYWKSVSDFFSTTSAINFVNSSTTIPKTYTSNSFSNANFFNGGLTAANIVAAGSTTLQNFTAANSTTTNATTTSFAISGLAPNAGLCLTVDAAGAVLTQSCGAGAVAFDFTPIPNFGTNTNATGTPIWFQGGLFASSTSVLASTTFALNGNVGIGTSSPFAALSLLAAATRSNINLFNISSTTAAGATASLFNIDNTGLATFGSDIAFATPSSIFIPSLISNAFNIATSSTATPILSVSTLANTASGSVGIGTSTPWGKFAIEMGPLNPAFVVSNSGSSSPSFIVAGVNQNGNVGISTSSPYAQLSITNIGSNPGFVVSNSLNTIAQFVVTSSGQVAIGTSTPATASVFTVATSSNAFSGAFNVLSSGATTSIQFFTSTSTGLAAGAGTGISSALKNYVIIGDGKTQAGLAVVKGGLCVDSDGWCAATTTGRVSAATAVTVGNTDLAEEFPSNDSLVAGEIVSTDGTGGERVSRASRNSGNTLIGVVSSAPGFLLGLSTDDLGTGKFPIALSGRVPVLVNLEGGSIDPGDPITVSSVDGVGKRATTTEFILGYALESYTGAGNTVTMYVSRSTYIADNQLHIGSTNSRIGISTTTPFAQLSVHGNAGSPVTTLFAIGSSTANSTTTLFTISNTGNSVLAGTASSSGLIVSGLNSANCDVKANTNGSLYCGTDATGAGGGSFAWTADSNFGLAVNATSTPIWFRGGLFASSTSYIAGAAFLSNGNVGVGTTTPGSLLAVGDTNGINFTAGTSTFNTSGGIDIKNGCFSVNGTCVAAPGGAGGGNGNNLINIQVFTADGTYVPSAGAKSALAIVTGAGGGGGGILGTDTTNETIAGGGGAGGTAIAFVDLTATSSVQVSIGTGGTAGAATGGTGGTGGSSSFSTFASAAGGTGGTGSAISATGCAANGGIGAAGVGGAGSGGSVDLAGGGGISGSCAAESVVGGSGGGSYWGAGGAGAPDPSGNAAVAGSDGVTYGGGGGGAAEEDATSGALGGVGAGGVVVVYEYGPFSGIMGTSTGGTGLGVAPAYGQVLVGNAAGGYDLVATSSLGISSGEGGSGFSTTSADFYVTASTSIVRTNAANTFTRKQTFTDASTTNISATYASSTQANFGSVIIGALTGVLHATAGVISSAAVNLASEVTGLLGIANGGTGTSTAPMLGQILVGNAAGEYDLLATSSLNIDISNITGIAQEAQGGTGQNDYTLGDILYSSGPGILSRLPIGASGQVLKVTGGIPAWGVDLTTGGGGGGGGLFSTTTSELIIYPTDTSKVVTIGTNATTTSNTIFEVSGRSYFSNNVWIATTSSPGSLLSVGGVADLNPAGSTFYSGLSVPSLTLGSVTGVLHASAGAISTAAVDLASEVAGFLGIANGGTGTSTAPAYGQVLVGNAAGGYDLIATSSLGISSGGVADGATIKNTGGILSLNLANANTWTGLQRFGNATTSLLESVTEFARAIQSTSTNALVLKTNFTSTAGLTLGGTSTVMLSFDTQNNRVTTGVGGSPNPTLFVADSGNTANDPTGVNGAIYYNSNASVNALRCFANNTWRTCDGSAASSTGDVQVKNIDGSFTATSNFNWSLANNGLTIKGAAGQTGGLFTVASSTGNALFGVSSNGVLELATTSDPSTPPDGQLDFYAKTVAGRVVPKWIGPSGLDTPFQAALYSNNTVIWTPTNATAGLWQGATAGTGAGTYANTNPTTGNLYSVQKRGKWTSVVTTTNQQIGQRNGDRQFFRGDAAGQGGFFFVARFGLEGWTTNTRYFVGLTVGTTNILASQNPTANLNTIGLAIDSGDTQWSFIHNDGTGTATKDTLTGMPALASGQGYDFYMFAKPNDPVVYYRIDNANTGVTITEGSTNVDLPASTTMMSPAAVAGNVANTTAGAAGIGLNRIYIETDR